jgi:hypothetical protein
LALAIALIAMLPLLVSSASALPPARKVFVAPFAVVGVTTAWPEADAVW